MKPTLIWEKARLLLPLIGDRVHSLEYRLPSFPIIVFQKADSTESELSVSQSASILFTSDASEERLEFRENPDDFSCLLKIGASIVTDSVAFRTGGLWIEFDRRFSLRIERDELQKYRPWPEANWSVKYPRSHIRRDYILKESPENYGFTIEGHDEELLVFEG